MKLHLLCALAGCVAIAACGGGGGGGGTPPLSPTTPTPSTSPSGSGLTASTQSLALIGTANPVSFTITDSGYTGAFTVNGCSGVATVSPGSASGPSAAFNVTATSAGTCALKISDTIGRSVTINVTATITTGTIQ